MPIPSFSELLNKVLNGDSPALTQWFEYTERNIFNEEEIKQTIDGINAAEEGLQKSYALYVNALWHQYGIGRDKNYPEAIRLYEEAIKLGNSSAMYNRAFMYQEGQGVLDGNRNYPQAISLYKEAIKLGHAGAMNNRAYMYHYGLGRERNYPKAIRFYEAAIERGNTRAMVNRAFMHRHGQGDAVNYPAAIALYEMAIKQGNAAAMVYRAYMYQYGQGSNVDYPAAIALFERASKLGNGEAMRALDQLRRLSQMERAEKNEPPVPGPIEFIEPNEQQVPAQTEENVQPCTLANISMLVLSGFVTVVGIAAVAIAFTALNAVTCGIAGVAVASVGVALTLSGIGLFATGIYINTATNNAPSLDVVDTMAAIP